MRIVSKIVGTLFGVLLLQAQGVDKERNRILEWQRIEQQTQDRLEQHRDWERQEEERERRNEVSPVDREIMCILAPLSCD